MRAPARAGRRGAGETRSAMRRGPKKKGPRATFLVNKHRFWNKKAVSARTVNRRIADDFEYGGVVPPESISAVHVLRRESATVCHNIATVKRNMHVKIFVDAVGILFKKGSSSGRYAHGVTGTDAASIATAVAGRLGHTHGVRWRRDRPRQARCEFSLDLEARASGLDGLKCLKQDVTLGVSSEASVSCTVSAPHLACHFRHPS